ncbi:hypothetical protein B0T22DRAFT_525983 [Podospora appendiculata]|uniref:Uncharacterized protein n=1 Tax=Podospora appendiculata TaxID=314037 RepID=A0AAE0XI47_9PEZI|nr:hypothetical protein B0T22DRAFT_525983 [Podospora appendiculata]
MHRRHFPRYTYLARVVSEARVDWLALKSTGDPQSVRCRCPLFLVVYPNKLPGCPSNHDFPLQLCFARTTPLPRSTNLCSHCSPLLDLPPIVDLRRRPSAVLERPANTLLRPADLKRYRSLGASHLSFPPRRQPKSSEQTTWERRALSSEISLAVLGESATHTSNCQRVLKGHFPSPRNVKYYPNRSSRAVGCHRCPVQLISSFMLVYLARVTPPWDTFCCFFTSPS